MEILEVTTEEIDLLSMGLKETDIKIPKSMSFGLGLGEDKKWFLGLNYKKTDSGGYKNQLMSLDNVEFKSSQPFQLVVFIYLSMIHLLII